MSKIWTPWTKLSNRQPGEKVIHASLSWLREPEAVIKAAHPKHGLSFYLKLQILGKTFVTGEPEHIRHIRTNPLLVGGRGMTVLRPLLGDDNLIMLDGERHKERRYALSQLFTPDRIKALDELMKHKLAETAIVHSEHKTVNIYSLFQDVLLTVIVAFLFPDSDKKVQERLEKEVSAFFHSVDPPFMLFFKPFQINLGSYSQWGRMLQAKRALQGSIKSILRSEHNVELINNGLSEQQIIDEMIALLLFGHDTSAAALAWATHHCLDHPQHIPILIEDPVYLEAVLLESMRLNPVVVHLTRIATADVFIGDQIIPKGMRVLPCAYLAHFNPEIFPGPDLFQPERFLHKDSYSDSYFPFGFGNRVCIGKHFALQQMRVLLPELFTKVQLEKVDDSAVVSVRDNVLMVPYGKVKMHLID
jgi:cytochrome P450